jgi:2-C-methyl-D-erythritol 4-phosphate cytidylyltransferase
MNQTLPKQFVVIAGKPVLVHTLEAFAASSDNLEIILVLPKDHFETWEVIKEKYLPLLRVHTVPGGNTRFQSVRNGLHFISESEGLVAIHDAVRPCISSEIIHASFESAEANGSGVVAIKLKDSIRELKAEQSIARDRNQFVLVQTPQTFQLSLIKAAFTQPESAQFTDDATVFEGAGHRIHLVDGDYQNIKITTAEDLSSCEIHLKNKKPD